MMVQFKINKLDPSHYKLSVHHSHDNERSLNKTYSFPYQHAQREYTPDMHNEMTEMPTGAEKVHLKTGLLNERHDINDFCCMPCPLIILARLSRDHKGKWR